MAGFNSTSFLLSNRGPVAFVFPRLVSTFVLYSLYWPSEAHVGLVTPTFTFPKTTPPPFESSANSCAWEIDTTTIPFHSLWVDSLVELYCSFLWMPLVRGPTIAGDSRHLTFQVYLAWTNCSIGTALPFHFVLSMYVDFTIPPGHILLMLKGQNLGLSRVTKWDDLYNIFSWTSLHGLM